jgi:hypothetical protein
MSRQCLVVVALVGLVSCGGGGGGSTSTSPEAPSGSFDLVFTGLAVPHIGQRLSVVVVREADDSVVADGSQNIGDDGSFSFSWSGLLEGGRSYHLDFYADHNGNGTCDPPPSDHAWQVYLGTVSGPVTYDWQHTADFVDVCTRFP